MSYARWGCEDSDVYIYLSVTGWYTCCCCSLLESEDMVRHMQLPSAAHMIEHLHQHELAGDKVPQSALERLLAETLKKAVKA